MKRKKRKYERRNPQPRCHPGEEMTCGGGDPLYTYHEERRIIADVKRGYKRHCDKMRVIAEREGWVWIDRPVQTEELERPYDFFEYADEHDDFRR